MFSQDALAGAPEARNRVKTRSLSAVRRSRPLSVAQEILLLGITLSVGLLLELAVVLRLSAVIE